MSECKDFVCAVCETYHTITTDAEMIAEMNKLGVWSDDGRSIVCDECYLILRPSWTAFAKGDLEAAITLIMALPPWMRDRAAKMGVK